MTMTATTRKKVVVMVVVVVDLLCSEMLADHIDHTSFQLMIPQSQFRCLIFASGFTFAVIEDQSQ